MTNAIQPEIFISYSWQDESRKIADELDQFFQKKGIRIIRDTRDVGYKGIIDEFMQRLSRGRYVIIILSSEYFKSKNCMYELIQISKHPGFYERIFPIIVGDAKIFDAEDRLEYSRYWEDKKNSLQENMIKGGDLANLHGIYEDLNFYTEIRTKINELTGFLQNIKAIIYSEQPELDFEPVSEAIFAKVKKDESMISLEDKRTTVKTIDFAFLKQVAFSDISSQLRGGYFFQKYIAKIYHPRTEANLKFNKFIHQSNERCFIITGRAGKGKTCLFCNLAESFFLPSYEGKQIAILVNSLDLNFEKTNLDEYIVKRFNPNNKLELNFDSIGEALLAEENAKLMVFIDAINELEGDNAFGMFNKQITTLLTIVKNKKYPIQFCISCRSDFWEIFRREEWVASNIYDPLGGINEPTYELEDFDLNEIDEVIKKYFKWYALDGQVTGDALKKCCDPIMLRYLCAAYTKRKADDPPDKEIPIFSIGAIKFLQRKEVFDIFVKNTRERNYERVRKVLHLPETTDPHYLYRLTTLYLIHLANVMLENGRAYITIAEAFKVAQKLNHPDAKLNENSFFYDPRSVFFVFVDEGIILDKRKEGQYDFVFESYFEFSLGRYLALERWSRLLPDGAISIPDSPYSINDNLIKDDFKKLLSQHSTLLKDGFTNLLGALQYAILVVEDDERYKNFPYLFIELLDAMIQEEQFIYRQKAFATIRETRLAACYDRDINPELYRKKLQDFFRILYKLTKKVDFVILWDLRDTVAKLAECDVYMAIEQMHDWAENGTGIQPMAATQILARMSPLNDVKVIEVLSNLAMQHNYRTNFWLARPLIFEFVELGKNTSKHSLSREHLNNLRRILEGFLTDDRVPNSIKGLALSAFPYLSMNEARPLEVIDKIIENEAYRWGFWNLAYELKNWNDIGACNNDSWVWKTLNKLAEKDDSHINYAIYKTAKVLERFNTKKADELTLGKLYSNRWLPDEFNGNYDAHKNMLTGIIYSPVYLEPSLYDHVECRERFQGILEKLIAIGEEYFNWVDPIKPNETVLQPVHNKNNDRHRDGTVWYNYLMEVKRASEIYEQKQGQHESSTGPSELRYESYDVALVSVGGVIRALDYVFRESATSAWSMGRPPGHLANNKICIFNNIAIGAHYAIKRYNIHRILIVDCDAHHGKHTAHVFRNDPNVLYFSMHIEGDYAKEEGTVDVIGDGAGKGYTFNLQYPANMDDDGYTYMIDKLLIPVAKEFKPELIMISAGFDGHFEDNLTPDCILTEHAYIHLAKRLRELASDLNIKIVGALEGGYGLESMANSFVHMISIIGDWKVSEDKIGFVKGSENRDISPTALKRVKDEVKTRIRLMKEAKDKNPQYRLFSDTDYWNKILHDES